MKYLSSAAALRTRQERAGFSLVEVMLTMAILVSILLVVTSIMNSTLEIWRKSSEKIEAFQAARTSFDLLARNISQATLNSYYDYDNKNAPTRYLRNSDLQFAISKPKISGLPGTPGSGQIVLFQAPLSTSTDYAKYGSLTHLLNGCGYYVEFGNQTGLPAHVAPRDRYRYRLMQVIVPSEANTIYKGSPAATNFSWFTDSLSLAQPVAENVIALIIRPIDPSPSGAIFPGDYSYNSRLDWTADPQPVTAHQLPPMVQITIVAISEKSALRMENGSAQPATIANALTGKFVDTAKYQADLSILETALRNASPSISYRVFTTSVPLRETKWTKQ